MSPWSQRLLLLGATACAGGAPGFPPGGSDPAPDSAALPEPEPEAAGPALVFADDLGTWLVDLDRGEQRRLNQHQGARPFLSPDGTLLLATTSGAGTLSEVTTLDGALVEDFAGAALGWAGPDHLVLAEVDEESLHLGPVVVWNLAERKREQVYTVRERRLRVSPHGHYGEAPVLVLLDLDTSPTTLISVDPPANARTRALSAMAPPLLTVDGRVVWLDEAGELWASDPELGSAAALTRGLNARSLGPWVEAGQVMVAFEGEDGPDVQRFDLDQRQLIPEGTWADIEGFDPAELRVHPDQDEVVWRVGGGFWVSDREGRGARRVAEAFGEVSGWDHAPGATGR